MRRGAPRSIAGITVGALAFVLALTFPASVGELPKPSGAGADRAAAAYREPAFEPGRAGWVERIAVQIGRRIPHLREDDRRRLARTVVGESEAARIDPVLVLALIQIESSFDPSALSDRGARGLMQLREATLRREIERAGLEWESAHDPAVNVQAGIRYLRRLLDAFGAEEIALMAYNAGPNRILGYLRGGEIPDRFRVYPRKVQEEVRRLRRSLGQDPRPTLASARTLPVPE